MHYKNLWKFINVLYAIAIILALAVGIRTLVYIIIGMESERTFRPGITSIWVIIIFVIIIRTFAKKYLK